MSVGLLGTISPAVNTETVLYLCPSSYKATGTVTICNTSSSGAVIYIGVSPTNTALTTANYRMFAVQLPANGEPIQLAGFVLTAGNSIRVKTDTSSVAFNFDGMEASLP